MCIHKTFGQFLGFIFDDPVRSEQKAVYSGFWVSLPGSIKEACYDIVAAGCRSSRENDPYVALL